MADDFELPEDVEEATKKTPGQKMRDQLEAALKEKKELLDRLAALEDQQRKSSRSDLLKQLGVNETFHELYTGEPDEAAIKTWAEKFGFLPTEGEANTGLGEQRPEAAAATRIQQATAEAFGLDDSLEAKLADPSVSFEDLVKSGLVRLTNYS